jgi:hypothetical protein
MTSNEALETILAFRALWQRKGGRVTLEDLEIRVRRCVRTRGHAALPPERWRCLPWHAATCHEWTLEA